MAGEAWDGSFSGGRVVRLEENGSWSEVHNPGTTGAWHLREFNAGSEPKLFYIAAAGSSTRPRRGTLYRSVDEGDTWVDVTPVTPQPEAPLTGYCIGISLGAGNRLWALCDDRENPGDLTPMSPNNEASHVYYSDDWGDNWTLSLSIQSPDCVFCGIDGLRRNYPAFNIAAHPTDPNKVVVEGMHATSGVARFWRTVDGGATWTNSFVPSWPTPPTAVNNLGGQMSMQLNYASDGSLIYSSFVAAGTTVVYIFRSIDDGDNFSTWHSVDESNVSNFGVDFLEGCTGVLWFIFRYEVYRSPDWATTPPTTEAERSVAPHSIDDTFMALSCPDGVNLSLGTHDPTPAPGCCDPPGVWTRPISLSSGWVTHGDWATMDADLGYRLYCWPKGLVGASPDRFALPCEDTDAVGDFVPQCIPLLNWQIKVDGQHAFYSRARAQGMGMHNAGQDHAARLPNENAWAPSGGDYGEEGGTYSVRREVIVNDYGINSAEDLDNLATAYLPLDTKEYGGITTITFQVGGIPRAGSSAPVPNKILQAGDRIQFDCSSGSGCGIAEGSWIVDEVRYAFPEGITTVVASKRPAAQVRPMASGNIRNIGESLAQVGGVYESPWFSVNDESFLVDPDLADPTAFYDTFQFQHHLGAMPRIITMIAAKSKIYDWYDSALVTAAQPLYVPRQFIDLSQVQGVGYNIIVADETRIVFHFWRYLFYDDLDGEWILPQNRYFKVWVTP
jgi:hypothetical protein